ncbi:hypothetical protein [Mesorhizobium sp. M8A.F.Ca.ET.165.01.1.1]|uniref:hypothetical protein n=1 Tax=Mesorhizobium sp. M8A.F.Ca.ET.165.01.1.1 TaxID=2563960 RepID=UPI001093E658|nr:hypothetical protein [Mesorhizobium sp. M8A.F.Ca.ET.165.01.1.1]TGT44407.1 hypothetical protein EN808_08615 [Mesorhizobium sp. M8A.F.Ca.ET.165.01.1.1]
MAEDQEALMELYDQSRSLKQAIGDIETTITAWLPRLQAEANAKRIITFLQDRYSAQRELIYELGTVAREIEELERHGATHTARSVGRDDIDRDNPLGWLKLVEPSQDGSFQDHLDWFREELAENPPGLDEPDLAEPLTEVERGPSPDDLLTWLPGRGRFS